MKTGLIVGLIAGVAIVLFSLSVIPSARRLAEVRTRLAPVEIAQR